MLNFYSVHASSRRLIVDSTEKSLILIKQLDSRTLKTTVSSRSRKGALIGLDKYMSGVSTYCKYGVKYSSLDS